MQALTMLEEKYGEEFAVEKYEGTEHLEGFFRITCYPKESPQLLFDSEIACDGSYIEDDYVSVKVCHKAEQKIEQNLERMDGYLLVKVVPVSRNVNSDNADMSVEEFVELKTKNRFAVYLMYCPQRKNAEKTYTEIEKTFDGLSSMSGNIQLYVMQEEELKKMQKYLSGVTELDDTFQDMTEDVERITIPFQNGQIQISEVDFTEKAGERL